ETAAHSVGRSIHHVHGGTQIPPTRSPAIAYAHDGRPTPAQSAPVRPRSPASAHTQSTPHAATPSTRLRLGHHIGQQNRLRLLRRRRPRHIPNSLEADVKDRHRSADDKDDIARHPHPLQNLVRPAADV